MDMDQVVMFAEWFSLPVKAGWAVFLAWTLLQMAWYRRARTAPTALRPLPPMAPERRRAVPAKTPPPSTTPMRPYGESSTARAYGEPSVADGITHA